MLLATVMGIAAAVGTSRVPVESLTSMHRGTVQRKGWASMGSADPTALVTVTVAVKQQGLDELERALWAVSDPDSARYGAFLSQQEVHKIVAPHQEHIERVTQWLHAAAGSTSPVTRATPNGDFLTCEMTVTEAEQLLGAKYHTYTHARTGSSVIRLALDGVPDAGGHAYTLPVDIAAVVDFVAPTVTFPPVSDRSPSSPKAKPTITPPKLRALANMTDSDVGKGPSVTAGAVKQGVASFIGEYYDPTDLKALRSKYGLSTDGLATLLQDVPKSQKHSPVGVEASLDVQYITSTGNEILTEHWSTEGAQPGNPENEPFIAWLTKVSSAGKDAPSLFSISYGDEEDGVTYSYAQRCSVEFQKAGARGITLLAASGDAGVGCSVTGFVPTFPASCPYVTGVGAVTGGTAGRSPTGESVADLSGGGFSNYFSRPSYQDDAVQGYLKNPTPAQKNWNASGAAFPDVAGQGILFDTCINGFFYPYSGTSAASPSVTGVFALLSQDRMDASLPRLGWLNPLLYKIGAADGSVRAFNDVTDGTNTFCDGDGGFSAAKGYDPVSGWGTINYGKMKGPILAAGRRQTKQFGRGYTYSEDRSNLMTRSVRGDELAYQRAAVLSNVDWRKRGAVSPVRDQGQGETCWAFSTAGAVEGALVAVGGAAGVTSLSSQYFVDCMSIPCANSTGTPDNAFAWLTKQGGGVYTAASYPYLDKDCIFWDLPHPCLNNGTIAADSVKHPTVGYHHTIVTNETDLMMAVAQQPVSVAVYSGLGSFTAYTGGIYYDSGCEGVTAPMLDHAVLVVGYGTDPDSGEDYWTVKNSWGATWGEDGFIRMRRNVKSSSGLCGIAIDASFPKLG